LAKYLTMVRFQNVLSLLFVGIVLSSCNPSTKEASGDLMVVKGSVEGLRKGTLFLQKIQDTMLIREPQNLNFKLLWRPQKFFISIWLKKTETA